MRILVLALCLVFFSAKAEALVTSNQLVSYCKSVEAQPLCFLYITAFLDGYKAAYNASNVAGGEGKRLFCIPKGEIIKKIATNVIKYSREHPKHNDTSARDYFHISLIMKYPC